MASGVTVDILVFGEKIVATKLQGMRINLANKHPMWEKIADYLMARAEGKFQSQGRAGGGSWKQLDKKWLKFKIAHGYSPKILEQRGILRRSVTRRNAPFQTLEISDNSLNFGTTVPYGPTHQFGDRSRGIPARPFLGANNADREVMRRIVRDHIMNGWSPRGGI